MSSKSKVSKTIGLAIIVIIVLGAVGAYYVFYNQPPTPSTTTMAVSQTSSAFQATNVTFGFAGTPDVTDTPGLMFNEQFAPQLGVNLNVKYFDGDAAVAQALVSGSVDVAEGAFPQVLLADITSGNSSGSYPFLVFAPYESTNDYAFVVSNSIKSWSDLAGKPIAVSSPGSASEMFCKQLLGEHGLSGSQVNCAPVGGGGTRIRALLAGQVVGDIAEPFAVVSAVQTGQYHIIATVPAEFPDLLFSVLYTSRTYAAAHPEVIARISQAIILADRWAQNETAWVNKEQLAFPDTNRTVAATSWKIWIAMNLWDPNGGLTEHKIDYSENFLIKVGQVNQYLASKYWVDYTYQTQALATLGAWTGPSTGYGDPSIPSLNVTIPGFAGMISISIPSAGWSIAPALGWVALASVLRPE